MEAILELKRSNLVLPSSGYELDREEMSYVEGGGIARDTFAISVDIAIVAISLICTVVSAAVLAHNLGKISKGLVGNVLKKAARDSLKKMIQGAGKALGISIISATVGAVDALAGILFDFSIGGAVAHLVDYADGSYNSICFG